MTCRYQMTAGQHAAIYAALREASARLRALLALTPPVADRPETADASRRIDSAMGVLDTICARQQYTADLSPAEIDTATAIVRSIRALLATEKSPDSA